MTSFVDEEFDALDCAGNRTGRRIRRAEAHAAGIWHGAFHCLIVYRRDGREYGLFQRRDRTKLIAPGKYDVSVGGHYAAGEAAENAGPRELAEELGLHVDFSALVPVGRRVFVYCHSPGIVEQEFQDVFLLPTASRPGGLVLEPGEVESVAELTITEGIALFTGDLASVEVDIFLPDGTAKRSLLSASDFVPCLDRYYLKLLQLAKRYLDGDRKGLAI